MTFWLWADELTNSAQVASFRYTHTVERYDGGAVMTVPLTSSSACRLLLFYSHLRTHMHSWLVVTFVCIIRSTWTNNHREFWIVLRRYWCIKGVWVLVDQYISSKREVFNIWLILELLYSKTRQACSHACVCALDIPVQLGLSETAPLSLSPSCAGHWECIYHSTEETSCERNIYEVQYSYMCLNWIRSSATWNLPCDTKSVCLLD